MIVFDGDLNGEEVPAGVLYRAGKVEEFCIDVLAKEVRVIIDGYVITSDQTYHESNEIITTVKEIDL